jgi:hypothetical protein
MAPVTGMPPANIWDLTNDSVVSAAIDENTGVLTLQTRDGQTITAGNVELPGTSSNDINTAVAQAVHDATDRSHPVGSIYMSTDATDPATVLGVGTWVRWGKGRVPVGIDEAQTEFDGVEELGGEKTHQLTVAEMPSHSHNEAVDSSYNAGTGTGVPTHYALNSNGASRSEVPMATSSTGGNAAHNNLQPYITCYMWKRTA